MTQKKTSYVPLGIFHARPKAVFWRNTLVFSMDAISAETAGRGVTVPENSSMSGVNDRPSATACSWDIHRRPSIVTAWPLRFTPFTNLTIFTAASSPPAAATAKYPDLTSTVARSDSRRRRTRPSSTSTRDRSSDAVTVNRVPRTVTSA